jgi:hypothetical protein
LVFPNRATDFRDLLFQWRVDNGDWEMVNLDQGQADVNGRSCFKTFAKQQEVELLGQTFCPGGCLFFGMFVTK